MPIISTKGDQPTRDEKVAILNGEKSADWDYVFDPGLIHCAGQWTNYDWINFIGNKWFRKTQKVAA